MRLALFLHPAFPVCGLATIWPMGLRMANGLIHEVPPLMLDENTGRMVPTLQHRISYLGLN